MPEVRSEKINRKSASGEENDGKDSGKEGLRGFFGGAGSDFRGGGEGRIVKNRSAGRRRVKARSARVRRRRSKTRGGALGRRSEVIIVHKNPRLISLTLC